MCAIKLKVGRKSSTNKIAKIIAIKLIKIVSVKNCLISEIWFEPSVFLIPTSLALPEERAVERFVKFMQAIRRIARAMIEKIYI